MHALQLYAFSMYTPHMYDLGSEEESPFGDHHRVRDDPASQSSQSIREAMPGGWQTLAGD